MLRCLSAVLALIAAPVLAQTELEVDLELILAADVSRSMSLAEREIQRRGYAAALSSDEVFGAIGGGMIGRIAISYVEWAGAGHHRVIVPWTLIESAEDAQAVARRITVDSVDRMRRTSISEALISAANSFDNNGFQGLRRVIDISGDGPNNQGRAVLLARSEVLGRGIIINGLPLMTQDALSLRWGIPDLDVYYAECVIGGPGSFMIPVLRWEEFEPAIKRKLILEIADSAPRASITRASGYDCLVGEKIWRRNMEYWYEP